MVSGTTIRGTIRLNDTLMLGPDALGAFVPVPIKSIHRKRLPVKEVKGGQTASFSLKKVRQLHSCFVSGFIKLVEHQKLSIDQASEPTQRNGTALAGLAPQGMLGV